MQTQDEYFMSLALEQAHLAAAQKEVPVGAAVVCGDRVVSRAYNRRETGKNALYHAELLAIDEACKALGGWRLHQCTLYVTLEPCPMCGGAIVNSRIARVVYGAPDPKAGCFGSLADFREIPFNHKPVVVSGVLEEECAGVLRDFFKSLRAKEKPLE